MNGQVEDVMKYDDRPIGSPVRVVKADPDLVSDVTISCSTPNLCEATERRYQEEILAWESIVADLPSDDEDGETFDKTVASLVIGMNMVQYLNLFKEADIGLNLFLTLTEDDLVVIGIEDKEHRKEIAHGIHNIRKKRGVQGQAPLRGLQDDVLDATMSVQETIPVMCHTVKHINNLVILLRNYRSRLNSNSVRNNVMDTHHSAALGAKILTKEALAQAELLKVQLHGMLLKLDPMRPEKFRKNKSASAKSRKERRMIYGAVIMSADG
ncbi:Ankyrin repeat and SAM domain-containing protein 3 [Frankliniella fusca]|uniref:Ankyrin repeat and SAM domain-containing protein 3 n=1 Tax=Frankliniella fusca TaxID=407009 RepID=A0AAE1LBJ7_9NEOP|nr:Ankyrin repeat and SAM domain-containing protein 3 [Frankliniella fusca]